MVEFILLIFWTIAIQISSHGGFGTELYCFSIGIVSLKLRFKGITQLVVILHQFFFSFLPSFWVTQNLIIEEICCLLGLEKMWYRLIVYTQCYGNIMVIKNSLVFYVYENWPWLLSSKKIFYLWVKRFGNKKGVPQWLDWDGTLLRAHHNQAHAGYSSSQTCMIVDVQLISTHTMKKRLDLRRLSAQRMFNKCTVSKYGKAFFDICIIHYYHVSLLTEIEESHNERLKLRNTKWFWSC